MSNVYIKKETPYYDEKIRRRVILFLLFFAISGSTALFIKKAVEWGGLGFSLWLFAVCVGSGLMCLLVLIDLFEAIEKREIVKHHRY